jgi:hypothetical protein
MKSKNFNLTIKEEKEELNLQMFYQTMLTLLRRQKINLEGSREIRREEITRLKRMIKMYNVKNYTISLDIDQKLLNKYKYYLDNKKARFSNNSEKLSYIKRLKESFFGSLKEARRRSKLIDGYNSYYSNGTRYSIPLIAIKKPGTILDLVRNKKLDLLRDSKGPKSNENHVAVEIECLIPRDKELDFKESILSLKDHVQIKRDGSILEIDDHKGIEIALVGPANSFPALLKTLCDSLNKFDAKVNKSCGLHVHLDSRNSDPNALYYNLVQSLPLLKTMVSKSRLRNQYCKLNKNKKVMNTKCRYFAVNGQAYGRYRTIEVRLHNGTTDFNKINNWVQILSAIAYSDKTILRWPKKLSTLKSVFNFSSDIIEYIESRQKTFTNTDNVLGDNETVREAA